MIRKMFEYFIIKKSGLFDAHYYLYHYKDVRRADINPLIHYIKYGWKEDRNPGPLFDTHYYLVSNPDVRQKKINPLFHYIRSGKNEAPRPADGLLDDSSREGVDKSKRTIHENVESISQPMPLKSPLRKKIRNGLYYLRVNGLKEFIKKVLRKLGTTQKKVTRRTENIRIDAVYNPYEAVYKKILDTSTGGDRSEYVHFIERKNSINLPDVKLIAFYLPQFHPFPENDAWWGRGFTEWTNVSKAVPQFLGHYQPRLPGELGFYDLRVPEIQRRQVELAKNYGIYGFCFHYYWFNGKRLLERPLDQFINDPQIDFPFCICWANENWTRRWDGREDDVLLEQVHSIENDRTFIHDIDPLLRHPNYIKIGDRPIIVVYRTSLLKDARKTANIWRKYCINQGLGNPYLVAAQTFGFYDPSTIGFDAAVEFPPNTYESKIITDEVDILNNQYTGNVYSYIEMAKRSISIPYKTEYRVIKTVTPSWDNEPRKPGRGETFIYSTPYQYQKWLEHCINQEVNFYPINERVVFINAWNEWGESAYLEPDRKFGYAYLQATADAIQSIKVTNSSMDWTILFVSHDSCQGGAQKVLLNIISWFKIHTSVKMRLLCLEGGAWLSKFEEIVETIVLPSLVEATPENQVERIKEFCGGTPDLIYANTVVSAQAFGWLSHLNAPILTHVHELKSSIERYAGEWVNDLLRYTDQFITCSNAGRDYIVQEYGVPISSCQVAYSFIQPSNKPPLNKTQKKMRRIQLRLQEDKILIIGCGVGMPFRKGADLFIEVAKQLKDKYENLFHFYWIGEFDANEIDINHGTWNKYLESISEFNLEGFVTFLGYKENPEDFLQVGDIFILPSREDPFPLVVMEAAQFELPIITFDKSGGSPEFVEDDAGIIVPFEDTQAMADAIIRIANDENFRYSLGYRARIKLFERFTIDKIAPFILSACRKAANKKPVVSIIVPNYNHAKYLPERLESIFNQTFQDFEVIILDDASTDSSREIIKEYSDKEGVNVILNEHNSGTPFKQWLKAIPFAMSEIIWIAESDDLCEPDLLEKLIPAFKDPEVKLAYCASQVIDEQGSIRGQYSEMDYLTSISPTRWKQSYCIPAEQEINEALGIKNTILNISSVLFRKFDLDEEFVDTLSKMHIGGDLFLILNVIRGGKIFYDAKPLNFHRRHSSSIVGKILTAQDEQRLRDFFQDFYNNIIYVTKSYRLQPDFPTKLEIYLKELWKTLAPNKPYEELNKFLPVNNMMKEVNRNTEKNDREVHRANRSIYEEYYPLLSEVDQKILNVNQQDIPELLNDIPLDVFAWLTLQEQDEFKNIKKFLPLMPDDEVQINWTGSSGKTLLNLSTTFVKTVIEYAEAVFGTENLTRINLLDFGVGWGRLIRLFYKYIPTRQLYAVDAWEESLKHCYECNIQANFRKIEEICTNIPFDIKFDLIISFSVFTHLSKRSAESALKALRQSIKTDGLFILTVRPIEYIQYFIEQHHLDYSISRMEEKFNTEGFVFLTPNGEQVDGEVSYGDTFISESYIQKNWRDWQIIDTKVNAVDSFQKIIVLKPK